MCFGGSQNSNRTDHTWKIGQFEKNRFHFFSTLISTNRSIINGWYHKKYHRFQSLHCSGNALFCPWIKASHCTDSTYSYVGKWVFSWAQQVSCDGITVLLQYITVPFGVFGEEQTSWITPTAFSDKIVSNSKKNKTKTNQIMGWIKNRPNNFSNQSFVRQTFPSKHQMPGFRFISLKCL